MSCTGTPPPAYDRLDDQRFQPTLQLQFDMSSGRLAEPIPIYVDGKEASSARRPAFLWMRQSRQSETNVLVAAAGEGGSHWLHTLGTVTRQSGITKVCLSDSQTLVLQRKHMFGQTRQFGTPQQTGVFVWRCGSREERRQARRDAEGGAVDSLLVLERQVEGGHRSMVARLVRQGGTGRLQLDMQWAKDGHEKREWTTESNEKHDMFMVLAVTTCLAMFQN